MGVMRYILRKPILGKNFIQYPTCKDVNLLAQFGLVKVVFREIPEETSKLQVAILDYNTNTLIYKQDGEPLLISDIIINQPYKIKFMPYLGGYIIYDINSQPKKLDKNEVDAK